MSLNPGVLVSVHCYQGDAHQVHLLRPYFEHHQAPLVIMSPEDSHVGPVGPHHCYSAGKAGYIGRHTWIRQKLQMEKLLELPGDFEWLLLHDADSLCITPKLPRYLFEDDNTIWSNLVEDFRKPGETFQGITWPNDYHAGYPLLASQPSYFAHRNAIRKICERIEDVQDDGITPFIDWVMVAAPTLAGVKLRRFQHCASCETQTELGRAVMTQQVAEHGATFLHAIKTRHALNTVLAARQRWLAAHPEDVT